jgi:hypothetical protein
MNLDIDLTSAAPRRTPPSPRRFGLGDAMILVGATAVGLMADRGLRSQGGWPGLQSLFSPPRWEWGPRQVYGFTLALFMIPYPLMASWTLATLGCGMRHPGPSRECLASRPGAVAAIALIPALAAWAVVAVASSLAGQGIGMRVLVYLPLGLGASVAGSWANQVVGRRWRPEPTWTDRFGRLLGAYWIVAALLGLGYLVAQ